MPKQQSTLWKHMYFRHAYSQLSPLQENYTNPVYITEVQCMGSGPGTLVWLKLGSASYTTATLAAVLFMHIH